MELDQSKADLLDATLAEYTEELRKAGEENSSATLAYTHGIHRIWRQVVTMLPIPEGSQVLDVGSGFGPLPLELAANAAVQVTGVDIEPEFVRHAVRIQERLDDRGNFFHPFSGVDLEVGDATELELADEAFDLVFVREVLQFITDPVAALREVHRVIKPGSFACVGDTDDQLRITWPPASPALGRLVDAVTDVQHAHGGDRQMGRKLTTYLRSAGFTINSLVVLPEAQHRVVGTEDTERMLVIEQLRAVRSLVISSGRLSPEDFDADLHALEDADPFEEFRLSARIIVLAQRPVDH